YQINFLTQAATTSLPRSRHYKQSYGSKELNESSMTNLQAGTIILGTLKYLIMVLFIQRFPRLFPTRDIIELAGLYLLIVIKRCLHLDTTRDVNLVDLCWRGYCTLAKHVMFLKLEYWKKACIFEEASILKGVLEVEDLEESLNLDLQRSFNLQILGRKLGSSKELQFSKVFLKLKTWKKTWIFKGASIFEGVLEIGVLKKTNLDFQRNFNSIFEGGRLQELKRLLSFGRILSRPYGFSLSIDTALL
uniref:Uncharacterized protein n=1 Tax=Cucumis melo TaxID=3656 RepID=A0A9I9E5W2_CUCME